MAHQITLTDEDYATLEAASARTGVPVDELVRRAIAECFAAPTQPRQRGRVFVSLGHSVDSR
jgi:ribbon-helix-helix protein